MTRLITAFVAATLAFATPVQADPGEFFSAREFLLLCKSGETWKRLACVSYVTATADSLIALTMSSGITGVGGICLPITAKLPVDDMIADTERLMKKWESKGDVMGKMPAAAVMLAAIRTRFPCK